MTMMEILAPAGGREQLEAAVLSGADAVYLGAKNFNARRNASNFEDTDLCETVSYCHSHNVKVHVTLNTLVCDNEIPLLIEEVKNIAKAGVDAVIVQDLGVARIVRETVPDLEMHASTQMTIHNLSGVQAAKELGFKRVVLSRELSLEEIRYICENTDVEIETFVHGALCMCMSGACYLSSMIGGRSGNRGLCAQPCRLDFQFKDKDHALSLKDMSYIPNLRELEKAGVCSVKIEGRMKRPEYVAAAVSACRQAREGLVPDMDSLKAVFSRQGFTDGYYTGKRTADMFGYRSHEDVLSSEKVLKSLRAIYKGENNYIPVNMSIFLSEYKSSILTVSDGAESVSVTGDVCEKAQNSAADYSLCLKYLSKTGNTPYYLENLSVDVEGSPFVSAGYLNNLRRDALDLLSAQKGCIKPHPCKETVLPSFPKHETTKKEIRVRALTFHQISFLSDADFVILPLDEILENPQKAEETKNLIAEISPILFVSEERKLEEKLKTLKEIGIDDVLTDNIGALYLAKKLGFNVHGGYGLNILNTVSLSEYERMGLCDALLSFENHAAKIKDFGGSLKRGILSYGFLPLMKTRACPLKSKDGCQNCKGRGMIKDRMGNDFLYLCSGRQFGTLLNSVPLYVSDKDIKGIDFEMLYFTQESPERCKEIFDLAISRKPFDADRTNGLYYRELL